jgi:putative acetyltransferase
MIKLLRTDANNPDFKDLIILLDAGLAISDGEDHQFYTQFNKTDQIK